MRHQWPRCGPGGREGFTCTIPTPKAGAILALRSTDARGTFVPPATSSLWHDGADLLADALTDPIARSRSWPVDLFDAAGLGAVTEPDGAECGSKHTNNEATRKTWAAAAGIELELVRKGQRHIQLFDAVRFWSYSVTRNDSKEAWTRRVTVRALEQNNRFSDGLPIGEVASLASKVADWTWKAGGRRLNHSKEVQRRRACLVRGARLLSPGRVPLPLQRQAGPPPPATTPQARSATTPAHQPPGRPLKKKRPGP